MTPWWLQLAWPLAVLFALGWALFAVTAMGHVIRHLRHRSRPAAARSGPGPAREYPPVPGPVPTLKEREVLDAIARARVAAGPGAAHSAQVIADGLRLRFPALDDTTLGLVALELFGYARTLAMGLPDPLHALNATIDAFGLTAEELTRLTRQGVPR